MTQKPSHKQLEQRIRELEKQTEQVEFEHLIAELAAKLAQVQPENSDAELQETLGSLGRFLATERAFIFQFSEDEESLKNTHVWAAEGFSPQSEIFELDLASDVPWVARQIRSGGVIILDPGHAELPDEAQELQQQLERDGIKSGFVVPLIVGGRSIGMLGLDTVDKAREYRAPLIERMRVLGDMIGSALARVRAQRKLQQSQHIIESTNNPVGLVNRNLVYQYVNEPYCEALNKSANEIIGHSIPELFGRDFFETVMKSHYRKCFAGENVNYQEWFDFPGWGRRYMDVRYYPYRDADGRITSVVINVHDITEVKQRDIVLKESEARFQAFMENIPGGIYIKDEDDVHLYCNQFAAGVVKRKSEDVIGSSTRDLHPPELADRLMKLDHKVLIENVSSVSDEYSHEGEEDARWYRDIKFPIQLESGKKLLGGVVLDISDIKNTEQELRKAYNEIEQLKQKLEQENIYLREEIEVNYRHEEIIGKSKPVMEMLSLAEQVAETDSTVLILGETGTGKELLARSIHKFSPRNNRRMIKVNCAALPATLIESELFGRERGAYTGAMTRQIGRFEIADGSTIFLDEIGELPLDVQAKLLRVLQEGQFERLGNPQTISVNVRIIASTNRDLTRAVSEGRFREDLYYRLNVFPITVPPLRDRIEDISLLVWSIVKEFEKSMGKTTEKIPQASIDALCRYPWPGNIRELRNVIENAMIISTGKTLNLKSPVLSSPDASKTFKLEVVERKHIIDVLEKTSWRVSGEKGAAKLLGLKPTTLESRMKKLGITRPR
jgi:PAS domain S-box-containing protein